MQRKPSRHMGEDPIEFQVLNEIGIIDQLAQNRAARLLSPELNMSQFIVLNHFARLGGNRSLTELASAMQVTKGAMSNTVARLLDKRLIAVKPDPRDGRGKVVSLTPAGRIARNRAVNRLGRGLAGLDAVLSAEELASTLGVLCRLRVWFDLNR
jgi:DNA-binding MarR family transcriptional regulator